MHSYVCCSWSGVLKLFMGLLRMGFVMRLLLHPLLSGFTSASALTILLGQLKHILGFSPVSINNLFELLADIRVHSPKEAHWPSLVMGVNAPFFLQTFKSIKLLRRLPAAFLVLALDVPAASLPVLPSKAISGAGIRCVHKHQSRLTRAPPVPSGDRGDEETQTPGPTHTLD
jgi:SulP family sulfate permease